jgi:hypothetical protein
MEHSFTRVAATARFFSSNSAGCSQLVAVDVSPRILLPQKLEPSQVGCYDSKVVPRVRKARRTGVAPVSIFKNLYLVFLIHLSKPAIQSW